ncbi:MAG: tetratricopeptide repeat protein [Saprospiraceae bacterium]|nr:tetratricopeptide repeat protein [Saprospiraceae bacterium]
MRLLFFLFSAVLFWTACQNNPASTTTAAAQIGATNPITLPTLLDRAEALRMGEEWDLVQNIYGQQSAVLRNNPNDAEARVKLAELFMQEARVTGEHPHYYPAAMQMLEPVIAQMSTQNNLNPVEKDLYFRALSHKASVQLSLHAFDQARQTAEAAIAINPYNAYIYGCLVDAQVELGQYDQAVQTCDKMVNIRPDLRSYARVSYLREIHGDMNGAIEAMDMAVKAGYPGYEQTEWARLKLGELYQKTGKWKEAEMQYQICLQNRPDYPFALAALAGLAVEKGRNDEAEALLKKAIAIIPEVGFNIDLAKLYRKTGREQEALALIEEIKGMFQEDIAAGHNMALEAARFHLELTKDFNQAQQFVQQEQQMRPNNKDVKQLSNEIRKAYSPQSTQSALR